MFLDVLTRILACLTALSVAVSFFVCRAWSTGGEAAGLDECDYSERFMFLDAVDDSGGVPDGVNDGG